MRELQLVDPLLRLAAGSDTRSTGAIVVSGSLVDLPGFAKRLGSDLGMPVSPADPFSRVELGPDVDPARAALRRCSWSRSGWGFED